MRTIVSRQFTVDKSYVEIFGTSTESKQTAGIVTGSRYTEVDTGDVYLFNETASEWVKQPAQGGGTGVGRFVVTFSFDEATETWSADKTFAECVAAWEAGQTMWALNSDLGAMVALATVVAEGGEPSFFGFYIADAESNTISGYSIDADGAYYYGN